MREQELEAALRALVEKLDALHADPDYRAVWLAHWPRWANHSRIPRIDKELETARKILGEK